MTAPAYNPPPRRSTTARARLFLAIAAVVVAAGLMWLVVGYASERPDQANLPGGDTFAVGNAKRFAERIDEQRAPIFFKDPLTAGAGREIYVLHDGDDPDEGWYAVLAYADPDSRKLECVLRWDIPERRFVDPCTGETYRRDNPKLTRYEATVEDGRVEVDLKS